MVNFVARKFYYLIQLLVGIFRRALCCFRRRRRSSCESSPLTSIGVVSNPDGGDKQMSWDSWEEGQEGEGEKLSQVEQHIRLYRQQRANLNVVKSEDEPPVDFFLDMAPRIVKPKKVYLSSEKTEPDSSSSGLSLAPDPSFSSPDLGVWEENQSWEVDGEDDVNVMDVLREQKRQERERKVLEQQRRKVDRSRQGVGVRSS